MKIIVTKEQHKVINEALGVPDSILDAAQEIYEIFLNDLESITEKEDSYNFDGELDITLGGKNKINIDSYTLEIEIIESDGLESNAKLAEMGMKQEFKFDRKIMMKRARRSTQADFSITYAVLPEWEPKDLVDEFVKDRASTISSLAHELKHKYDKQSKRIDLIGRDAEYIAHQNIPRFLTPVIDQEFIRYLYLTDVAENLVRATEAASDIRERGITKSQFRDYLKNNRIFKYMMKIKDFTFDDLVKGIEDNMDTIEQIFKRVDIDYDDMTEIEKVNKFLELVYINIVNKKMEVFNNFIEKGVPLFADFLKMLGGHVDEDDIKIEEIKQNFQNYILKYENNPVEYFKAEINKFHKVADQTIRKIGKLYAMAKDDEVVNESIINWELHLKLLEKKYGPRPIHTEFLYKKK